jgi:hypothetical protein
MSLTAIYCGVLLIIVGIAGYVYGISIGHASPTALIPAAFGLLLAVLGFIARSRDDLRKHIMHVAVLLGLVGFIAALGSLFRNGVPSSLGAGPLSQIAMAVICLVFVILCVKSFIDARRAEKI